MRYEPAWAEQERAHAQVLAGGEERLLLVEHPPVVTFGRRPGVERNLVAPADQLARLGVEVVQSDRGGDITFHGPGQIVAYPIVRLAAHRLSVSGYVHLLEQMVIETLAELGIEAFVDPSAVGVWVKPEGARAPAKICALGVRIRRGISMHGIALNVETDLRWFDLIVPCGLRDRGVTSVRQLLGENAPGMERVKAVLAGRMVAGFSADAEAGGKDPAGSGRKG